MPAHRHTPSTRQRKTRQLELIHNTVHEAADFQSAADIFTKLQVTGQKISLATVYRTLTALTEDGVLATMKTSDGTTLYRECPAAEHHHHLRCRNCGRTEDFILEGLEKRLRDIANQYGFSNLNHVIELSGLCTDCR